MSEVRLVIRDVHREIYGEAHASFAECVIAALSAEPETIEELELALERFVAPQEGGNLRLFRPGVNDQPHDAGIVIVDLAARMVACDSTYSAPTQEGYVDYHDGRAATDIGVRYHLSEDWELVPHMQSWQDRADLRRRARLDKPPLDARSVLYGPAMLEFIIQECLATVGNCMPEADPATPAQEDQEDDLVRQIHAKWLMTPRTDLGTQAPRDVLLARHEFVDWDLQDRCDQWSQMQQPPRPLDINSAAYRFGGFGTHEIVTYYDLVRHLIWSGRELVGAATASTDARKEPPALVERLTELRDEWLDTPDPELSRRTTPRSIIHNERIRMPEGCSPEDAVIDCDCPLCQMQADMPGPVFWHLDGSNMDYDFAFSFHRTREQFDEEEREHEEFNRRWEEQRAEEQRLGLKPGDGWVGDITDCADVETAGVGRAPFIQLFEIGAKLAEIIVELKNPTRQGALIDRLSRDFSNLREVVQGKDDATAESLTQPVLQRFCDSLDAVTAARSDLEAKCEALREQLGGFMQSNDET